MDFCATPAVSIAMTKEALALLYLISRDTKNLGKFEGDFRLHVFFAGSPLTTSVPVPNTKSKELTEFRQRSNFFHK